MARINPIELQKSLKGMDYPARKRDLVDKAEENGADAKIRDFLRDLPDHEYKTPADVQRELGKAA